MGTFAQVVRLPGEAFNHKFALDAWGSAPRGGMFAIIVSLGLVELISNRCVLSRTSLAAFCPLGAVVNAVECVHRASLRSCCVLRARQGSLIHRCSSRCGPDATLELKLCPLCSFAMTPVDMFANPNRKVRLLPGLLPLASHVHKRDRVRGIWCCAEQLNTVASEFSGACMARLCHAQGVDSEVVPQHLPGLMVTTLGSPLTPPRLLQPGNLGFDPLQLGNNAEVRAKYELAEVRPRPVTPILPRSLVVFGRWVSIYPTYDDLYFGRESVLFFEGGGGGARLQGSGAGSRTMQS